jgi:FMN phosphatase YigB (HAD superfamily)
VPRRLPDFKVLTFACYGTLIDWETGIWDALQPLLMKNPGSDVVRSKALETFARAEKKIETETPSMLYPDVLFDAVYTAQDIGAYKPSPRNFEYLLNAARRERPRIASATTAVQADSFAAKTLVSIEAIFAQGWMIAVFAAVGAHLAPRFSRIAE